LGRPAYKRVSDDGETPVWELPVCFIFEFSAIKNPARVFPFDSGAFAQGRYPSYTKMMKVQEFDCAAVDQAPERIIGAYFGSASAYFELQPKSESAFVAEHNINALDSEVSAIHRLSTEKSSGRFDDRRITIEVQSKEELDLAVTKPLAVVAPTDYFSVPQFRSKIVNEWGAIPVPYSKNPTNIQLYYGKIYDAVRELYRSMGLLP
jgi:hypothetical protein